MNRISEPDRVQTLIIGAGQAGLSVGYHLARQKRSFLIIDAGRRVGDSWRTRWDSLRLFTPAKFDGLDGMPFPADGNSFPTKDEMGNYLESYARRFNLPVRGGVRVDSVTRHGTRYLVSAGDQQFDAEHIVVAMATYQERRVPSFASQLDTSIVQLHSVDYRNPEQLQPGPVLIVGAGNSGAEIAAELARRGHHIVMSGRDTGHVPFALNGVIGRYFMTRFVLRVIFHRVLTLGTPLGRKMREQVLSHGGPLIRVKPKDLAKAGVERVGRMAGVKDGRPVLDDGRSLDVANVVWCTGFDHGTPWIQLPVFDGHGEPIHQRGVVTGEPGLYFVGRHFIYAMSSTMIHGVGRDAAYVAETIAARTGEQPVWTGNRPIVPLPLAR